MILDQQEPPPQSSVGAVWAKTIEVVEKLFLFGALLVSIHLLGGAVALVCVLWKLAAPPLWIWEELRVIAFPLIFIMWFRLLCVITTYSLPTSRKGHYFDIFLASVVALVFDLHLILSPDIAFPVVGIAYIFQLALDARLPQNRRQKKRTTPSASRSTATSRTKSRSPTRREQSSLSQKSNTLVDRQALWAETYTSASLSQKVGIWHSPADERFVERFRKHLQPKIREGDIDLWDASQIKPGTLWQEARANVVQSAAVIVVFVSADLLASDVIAKELPLLLHRAASQNALILILHANKCNFKDSGLERFYPVNSADKPLARLRRFECEEVLAQAALQVCQRLGISQ